jgi:hypothetical protein
MDKPYIQEIPFKETKGHNAGVITNAAIRVGDKVYVGWRHAHIMYHLNYNDLCEHVSSDMQGFVDETGNFFNRYQTQRIVWHTKQMPFGKKLAPELLSEHLWDEDGTPVIYEDEVKEPEKKGPPPVKPYVPVGYKKH